MSGILDSKTRIMDVVLTVEGRRQIAAGKFVPQFASFTDRHVFYAKDAVSGSDDASAYIYFEAGNRVQDQIVIENDDSGLLVPYDGSTTRVSSDGRVYSASIDTLTSPGGVGTYNRVNYAPVTSSFASMFELVSGSILDSLTDQQLIQTTLPYEIYSQFKLTTGSITFRRNNFVPFRGTQPVGQIGSLDPFMIDRQLAHLDNFQFLAPVYIDDTDVQQNLGTYLPISEVEPLTYDELMRNLVGSDPQVSLKEKITVDFAETSLASNVFMQIFEGSTTDSTGVEMLKKLDCIDFGEFKDENDRQRPFKRVFFVGKVYAADSEDNFQAPAFVNLFTIVAE
jgi:hypothetical protein